MKENTKDKCIKAFISVAEMLEPYVKFNDVNDHWHKISDGVREGIDRDISVSGRLGNELVIVSTEQHPTEGLQVVSTHYNINTMKLLSKRSVWYFSFNWKGIEAIDGKILVNY